MPGCVDRHPSRAAQYRSAMLRHVVLFRWAPEVTEAQEQAVVDGLAGLRAAIPEIAEYRYGPDLGLAEGNHDFAIVTDFASRDDYGIYRDHPAHRQFIAERIRPLLGERVAVQFDH
jgi:hypothetical protein